MLTEDALRDKYYSNEHWEMVLENESKYKINKEWILNGKNADRNWRITEEMIKWR